MDKRIEECLLKLAFRTGFSDIALDPEKADATMELLNSLSKDFQKLLKVINILKERMRIVAVTEELEWSAKARVPKIELSLNEHELFKEVFGED